MIDLILITLFGVWLILSALNQFYHGKWIAPLKRRDKLGLIPIWTFFAPNPGRSDHHLLYRDETEDGVGCWKEIDLRRGSIVRAFWHPARRVNKAVNDAIHSLMRPRPELKDSRRGRMIEVPYITLLSYVSRQPRGFNALRRRFLIARTEGVESHDRPKIIFISEAHRFPLAQRRPPTLFTDDAIWNSKL